MKKYLPLLMFLILAVASCSKESNDEGDVWVRIENASATRLDNVETGTINYGTILEGATTEYKLMPEPVYGAYCKLSSEAGTAYAGYMVCGTPHPKAFEPGYYTY